MDGDSTTQGAGVIAEVDSYGALLPINEVHERLQSGINGASRPISEVWYRTSK